MYCERSREGEREGGVKANSAQAWMQARSKVWPEATMTGSAMREHEIGQMNSAGGSAVMEVAGEVEGEGEAELRLNGKRSLPVPIARAAVVRAGED